MKKQILILLVATFLLQSCATVLGGKIDNCQKYKPRNEKRQLRPVPFIANLVLFWPGIFIDLSTNAAYKPCK